MSDSPEGNTPPQSQYIKKILEEDPGKGYTKVEHTTPNGDIIIIEKYTSGAVVDERKYFFGSVGQSIEVSKRTSAESLTVSFFSIPSDILYGKVGSINYILNQRDVKKDGTDRQIGVVMYSEGELLSVRIDPLTKIGLTPQDKVDREKLLADFEFAIDQLGKIVYGEVNTFTPPYFYLLNFGTRSVGFTNSIEFPPIASSQIEYGQEFVYNERNLTVSRSGDKIVIEQSILFNGETKIFQMKFPLYLSSSIDELRKQLESDEWQSVINNLGMSAHFL